MEQELESQLEQKKKNLTDFESKIDMWNFESIDYSKKRKEESREVISKAIQDKALEDMKARRDRKFQQSYTDKTGNSGQQQPKIK